MKNNKGFTIIEVLLALVLLSVGLLGIAGLQITIMRGNASAKRITEAITLAQKKLEVLSSLPPSDPRLADPDWPAEDIGTNIIDNTELFTNPDHGDDSTIEGISSVYNVLVNFPSPGLRTITIIVGWRDYGWHYHTITTVL
ncbi:MAG: type IV pilus modification PilV family protein [bacterium]